METNNKAMAYAEKKSSEMIINAIKDAYIDGYKAGYNDRDNQLPGDFEEDGVEYVDLGLPSGRLWSFDYLKKNGEIVYLPYEEAIKYNIPNVEQCRELMLNCKCINSNNDYLKVIGPNGNYIKFYKQGFYNYAKSYVSTNESYIWTNSKIYEYKVPCFSCQLIPNSYIKGYFRIGRISKNSKIPVKLVK